MFKGLSTIKTEINFISTDT